MCNPPLQSSKGNLPNNGAETENDQLEELVQLLVNRIGKLNGYLPHNQMKSLAEEVLLDVDVNGARYLLVRLPESSRVRVQLSPREHEIVRMVAMGHPNKIIADVLSISSWTVGTHLRRIFAKLGVGSRAAMVARLHEVGKLDSRGTTRQSACEDASVKRVVTYRAVSESNGFRQH